MKLVSTLLLLGALVTGVYAQRPRSADTQPSASTPTPAVKPAPKTIKVKYEGGVFGYTKTMQ